jgi:hypothetical protein
MGASFRAPVTTVAHELALIAGCTASHSLSKYTSSLCFVFGHSYLYGYGHCDSDSYLYGYGHCDSDTVSSCHITMLCFLRLQCKMIALCTHVVIFTISLVIYAAKEEPRQSNEAPVYASFPRIGPRVIL